LNQLEEKNLIYYTRKKIVINDISKILPQL